jgi:hypothetical protein
MEKAVNRLRQVTWSIKQDGASQVGIIDSRSRAAPAGGIAVKKKGHEGL